MALAAGAAGQGDQRHLAPPGGDRLGRMGDMRDVGAAAHIGAVHVAQAQVHVVGHRHGPHARRVAGAEIAVHVVLRQPGVLQRAGGRFGVQLGDGLVRRLAGRVLEGTHDVSLAV